MALDARKMRILKAIIDDYILTATPVGSRTIAKSTDIGLSSATIRNEMADLEELGYLEQPHTSAGRIPSDKAYRLYVDSIMKSAKLTGEELGYIRSHYSKKLDQVDDVVKQTAFVLSSITRYTSMVLTPRLHTARLKYIHLVPMAEGRALLLVVTDSGLARDSLIRVPAGLGADELEALSRMLNGALAGRKLDEIAATRLDELSGGLAFRRVFLDSVVETITGSLEREMRRVELSGATNILNFPEYSDVSRAKELLSTIEQKEILYKMLADAPALEFTVRIGSENEARGIDGCSVITATYRLGNEPIGSYGVIGPTRMDYAKVIALMRQIGRSMSTVLTNMFEEERN